MKKRIEISVDEGVFDESSKIFNRIGMDMEMAINIFLRRTVTEKGFPLSLVAAPLDSLDPINNPSFRSPVAKDDRLQESVTRQEHRTNTAVTKSMVDEVWNTFRTYLRGSGDIKELSQDISKRSGMNPGSAFIYLCILNNLVNGDRNTRSMKFADLEYLLKRIKIELDEEAFSNALASLKLSVPYWKEKLPGDFADKAEKLIERMK